MKVVTYELSESFSVELTAETAAEAAMLCRMGLQSKAHDGAAPSVYAFADNSIMAHMEFHKVARKLRTSRIGRK